MLIVVPVAIKTHLHNVCAKNNYELLIAQEPAESARSDGGGARGDVCKMGARVCADGGTALNHRTKKKKRFEEPCVQTPGSTGAEASISSAQKHLAFQMKLMYILYFFPPPFLFVWLFFFSSFADGETEGIWELLR